MAKGNTDSSSVAQARFVVSLPKEIGAGLDKLIQRTSEKLREQRIPGVQLSRAQMVQTMVQDALAAAENGDSTDKTADATEVPA